MKKILLYFIGFVFIIINIFCINLYATEEGVEEATTPEIIEQSQIVEEHCIAEVKKVEEIKDSSENPNAKVQEVTLEILDGSYKDKEVTANYVISSKENYEKTGLVVGDEVNVIISGDVQGNLFVTVQNLHRGTYIVLIFAILLIAVVFLYEKNSLKPILSSVCLVILTYFLLFKSIADGHNIIVTTFFWGIILAIIESIINNGFNKKIWIALLGTLGGVLFSIILSIIFMNLTRININSEPLVSSNMNYENLLLGGTIITAFGACMNLAMYIIQSLDKKKVETKDFFTKDLFKLGVIYGKQQATKFVNTLIIVFGGISFSLIMAYSSNYNNVFDILSQDTISAGIITIISTCVGIIASIPIISIFYALINNRKTRYKTTSENKVDGKRSLKI